VKTASETAIINVQQRVYRLVNGSVTHIRTAKK